MTIPAGPLPKRPTTGKSRRESSRKQNFHRSGSSVAMRQDTFTRQTGAESMTSGRTSPASWRSSCAEKPERRSTFSLPKSWMKPAMPIRWPRTGFPSTTSSAMRSQRRAGSSALPRPSPTLREGIWRSRERRKFCRFRHRPSAAPGSAQAALPATTSATTKSMT